MKTIALLGSLVVLSSADVFAAGKAAAPSPVRAATEPTSEEMAPILVPSAPLTQSDFASRLSKTCAALTPDALSVAAAANTKVAEANVAAVKANARAFGAETTPALDKPLRGSRLALENLAFAPVVPGAKAAPAPSRAALDTMGLLESTCERIKTGVELTDDDLASLRAFRANPTAANERIKSLLRQHSPAKQGASPPDALSTGSLQSAIINGLAKFVYDRAKVQSITYLRGQLTTKLCGTRSANGPGLPRLLVPATCTAIETTGATVPLGAIGTYVAAAARRDLEQLPDRALAYELHMVGNDAGQAHAREMMFGARLALAYYRAVAAGRTPLDVARSMHTIAIPTSNEGGRDVDLVVGYRTKVFKAVVRTSDFVDAIAAQDGWSDVQDAAVPEARFYALGVIFSLEDAFAQDSIPMPALKGDIVAKQIPVVAQYLAEIARLVERAKEVAQALSAAPSASQGDYTPATTAAGTATVRDLILIATQTFEHMLRDGAALARVLGADMDAETAHIDKVLKVIELGEVLVDHSSPSQVLLVTSEVVAALHRKAGLDAASGAGSALKDMQHLLALVAQIAQATSADEVATILDAAASPPDLYKQKYQRSMVTVGALAGASAGREWVQATGANWSGQWLAGAFAPVGLTISRPLGDHVHIGGMLSVINLGSLVSARFAADVKNDGTKETTVATDPQLRFESVFSPGAFVTLGFCGSPFVLTVGGQVVPSARQLVTTDTAMPAQPATSSRGTAIQAVAALAVDVPLFEF